MKTFNGIELKIDIICYTGIIIHFNVPLFLEPEVKVHDKIVSDLHDTHSLIDLDENDYGCDDEECEGCEDCDNDEDLDECTSFIEMVKEIKGVSNVHFLGYAIGISKGDFFFKWEDIINEIIQILLLHHKDSTGVAKLIKIEFKGDAKKNIGLENLESFIKKFPKKYSL